MRGGTGSGEVKGDEQKDLECFKFNVHMNNHVHVELETSKS